jgi:hypothetical protein
MEEYAEEIDMGLFFKCSARIFLNDENTSKHVTIVGLWFVLRMWDLPGKRKVKKTIKSSITVS